MPSYVLVPLPPFLGQSLCFTSTTIWSSSCSIPSSPAPLSVCLSACMISQLLVSLSLSALELLRLPSLPSEPTVCDGTSVLIFNCAQS